MFEIAGAGRARLIFPAKDLIARTEPRRPRRHRGSSGLASLPPTTAPPPRPSRPAPSNTSEAGSGIGVGGTAVSTMLAAVVWLGAVKVSEKIASSLAIAPRVMLGKI